jgi:hypothetical protein
MPLLSRFGFIILIASALSSRGDEAPFIFSNDVPELVALLGPQPSSTPTELTAVRDLLNARDFYRRIFGTLRVEEIASFAKVIDRVGPLFTEEKGLVLRRAIERDYAAFKRLLPDAKDGFSVVLLPSFGRFAGQGRAFEDSEVLMIGVDKVKLTAEGGLATPFVQHEICHVYRYQRSPECRADVRGYFEHGTMPPLAHLMWEEGMACYVARQLNPTASESEILIGAPLAEVKARWMELLEEAKAEMTKQGPQSIAGFFYFQRKGAKPLPIDCGYVIGEAVVANVAKRLSLQEMMSLQGPKLLQEMIAAIDELRLVASGK